MDSTEPLWRQALRRDRAEAQNKRLVGTGLSPYELRRDDRRRSALRERAGHIDIVSDLDIRDRSFFSACHNELRIRICGDRPVEARAAPCDRDGDGAIGDRRDHRTADEHEAVVRDMYFMHRDRGRHRTAREC